MRWKKKIKQVPKDGEVRITKKFLLFPDYINGEWVWLETIKFKKTYHSDKFLDNGNYVLGWWDVKIIKC